MEWSWNSGPFWGTYPHIHSNFLCTLSSHLSYNEKSQTVGPCTAERRKTNNLMQMNNSSFSILSTVSSFSIYRSQLGKLPYFLVALGSRNSTTVLALSEGAASVLLYINARRHITWPNHPLEYSAQHGWLQWNVCKQWALMRDYYELVWCTCMATQSHS